MSRCAFGTAPRRCATWCFPSVQSGTEKLSEDALAALVTRDAMVGVAKVTRAAPGRRRMNGVHDMGGMQDMGPIQTGEERAGLSCTLGRRECLRCTAPLAAWRKWNLDAARTENETDSSRRISAHELLRKLATRCWWMLLDRKHGLVTSAEIEAVGPARGSRQGYPCAQRRRQIRPLRRFGRRLQAGMLPVAPRFQGGPARARPQHQSRGPHAPAALCPRQTWHDRSRSWRFCFPGH